MDSYFDILNEDILCIVSKNLLSNMTDMVNLSNTFNIFQDIFSKPILYYYDKFMMDDKYISYVFNQGVSKTGLFWIDIYLLYYRLKQIIKSYIAEIKILYKDDNENKRFYLDFREISMLLIPNIDIFDIPGFNRYQILVNYINYITIHSDMAHRIECRLFITKQNNGILLHERYYTLSRVGFPLDLEDHSYVITEDALYILIIKMMCAGMTVFVGY